MIFTELAPTPKAHSHHSTLNHIIKEISVSLFETVHSHTVAFKI